MAPQYSIIDVDYSTDRMLRHMTSAEGIRAVIHEHSAHELIAHIKAFNRISENDKGQFFDHISPEQLSELQKGLREALAAVDDELANNNEKRHQRGVVHSLVVAISQGDMPKAIEILESGVQIAPGSQAHADIWIIGQVKTQSEQDALDNSSIQELLEDHNLGVPSDPSTAKAFIANVIPRLEHRYHEAGSVADAIAAHGAEEELVADFAARCVEHNDFNSFDKVAHLLNKNELPLRDLPMEGLSALAERSIPIPSKELFEQVAAGILVEGNVEQLKDASHLKLRDGSSIDFPRTIEREYLVRNMSVLPSDTLKSLAELGLDEKVINLAAHDAIVYNKHDRLRELFENGICDPNCVIEAGNSLAHVLAKTPRYDVASDGVGSDVKTLQVLTEFGVDLAAKNDEGKTASDCVSRSRKKLLAAFHAAEAQQMLATEVKPAAGAKLQAP